MKLKIIGDMILNIISTALPIALLQLLLLPKMAVVLGDNLYGLLITLFALTQTVSATLGNALNNIRLIWNEKYVELGIEGDFKPLLLILGTINGVISLFFIVYYEGLNNIYSVILTLVLASLVFLCEYLIVGFRIKINYKAILFDNIFKCIGYFVGYFLFLSIRYWQFVYIFGQFFSLLYIVLHTNIWKEKFIFTKYFRKCGQSTAALAFSKILNSTFTYADKLIIFPLLGGTSVSVYFAATVFGKIISMAINPINSVALTYLAKQKKKNNQIFWYSICLSGLGCLFGAIFYIFISKPLLSYLYPQYLDEAMKLIYLAAATMAMRTMIAVADPFILRFFDMTWQVKMNIVTAFVYLSSGIVLIKNYGLIGFCWGALITYIVKFIVMLIIFTKVHTSENI